LGLPIPDCGGLFGFGYNIVGGLCIGSIISYWVGHPILIEGRSMTPTLYPNEFVWINSLRSWLLPNENCDPGQIAIFKSPRERHSLIIKRIVAREGDMVYPRNGGAPITIPRGHCWVEGDNADLSVDSNDYGPIPMALYIGNAWRPRRTKKDDTLFRHRVQRKD